MNRKEIRKILMVKANRRCDFQSTTLERAVIFAAGLQVGRNCTEENALFRSRRSFGLEDNSDNGRG